MGDYSEWDCARVQQWLRDIGLEEYTDTFKNHKIDGNVLSMLNETDLREKPLCMSVLGDIKRLSKELDSLKKGLSPLKIEPTPQREIKKMELVRRRISQIPELFNSKVGSYSHNMLERYEHILPSILTAKLWQPDERWISSVVKLAASALYLFFSIFCTSFVMMLCHERVPDTVLYPPLPDIVLDNLPHIPWAFKVAEIIVFILASILVFDVIFHAHRMIILRRFCAITGSIFMLRCVTMFVTSLSVPGKHLSSDCKKMSDGFGDWDAKLSRAWTIASGLGLSVAGVTTCGDYMFSGHSSILTLLNFFINEYTPYSWKGLHVISWCLNMFGMFFVLAAHEHYTLDVICAFYISSRMFMHYHQLANIHHVVQKNAERERIRSWFPMFSFLESETEGIVPYEFEYPWTPLFGEKANHVTSPYTTKKSKKKRKTSSGTPIESL
ncbi:sphingomyelin synthase-related protein [Acrasis kona]|uniref:Sphingomyelin synthase-related protein n=1 Tax=Acrasis kona TaxID=1008807 RepID=A0AAW2Z4J5_9EUKA